jgi:Tfp pilus assembly protein PilF
MAKNKLSQKQVLRKETEKNTVSQTKNIPTTPFQIDEKWVLLILVALVFFCYLPVWQNDFVWDDNVYILGNDMVKNFDLKAIFTEPAVGNYHPLTMLSLAIEWALVKDQTWLYRLDNLLLHIANSWLVFKIFRKLNQTFLVSFIVAVLFAVHPLHVESVAWAAERKDVLYTFFQLLAFFYYLKFDESQNKFYYGISLLLFVASCMSKGMGVVLPAILIITDYVFLKKPLGMKALANKIPYFIITFLFGYIATQAQKEAGADAAGILSAVYTFGERLMLSSYAFCFYWIKTILPFNLYPFYPYPNKPTGGLPSIYALALLGMIALVGVLYWFGRKDKRIWWAVAFFAIAISTVIQFPFPVGSALVADRYYYLSSIGPIFIIALIINQLYKKSSVWLNIFYAIAFVLCILTFIQARTWKNPYTLFSAAEKAYPTDPMILSNIGWHYVNVKDFALGKKYLKASDDNGFKNGNVCRTLGSLYLDENDPQTALKYFEKATQYLPKSNQTNWLLATAYHRTGDFANAAKYFKNAVDAEPQRADYWNDYGLSLTNVGKYEESKKALKKAIALKPDLWDAYLNHAFNFRKQGDLITETKELDELINKNPNYLVAYRNIGVSFLDLKQEQKAIDYWKIAAQKDSTGEYEYNIGLVYVKKNDIPNAEQWYIKAAKKGNINAKTVLQKNGVQI